MDTFHVVYKYWTANFLAAETGMRYFAKNKFSRTLIQKKKYSFYQGN